MSTQIFITICFGILGLIIGSFLNVVILRFDDLRSIVKTRSHCMKCKKEIAWYDLVPFFSYILLWGKCRSCKKEISIQYPLVELSTGLLFAFLFYKFGFSLQFFTLLLISVVLIIIFVYDILHLLISDFLVWLAIGIWVLYLILDFFFVHGYLFSLLNSLYGGLALGGFLGLLVLLSRERWMGAGDIKLGFLLGMISSWPLVLLTSFSAFVLGSIIGLILICFKIKKLKDQIPFAPFLILATFLTIFFGAQIYAWYWKMMGL